MLQNLHVKGLLISSVLMVLCSFIRTYMVGTIVVDGHLLVGGNLLIVAGLFIGSLAYYSTSLYRLWQLNTLSLSQARVLSYVTIVVYSFMLPLLSNDIFSLLTYGDASNKGIDVYTLASGGLDVSSYYPLVSDFWKTTQCVYGPLSLYMVKLTCGIESHNIYFSLLVYKVFVLFWCLFFIEIMYRIFRLLDLAPRNYLYLALNPLFMIQAVGQLHCDGVALVLTASMIYFYLIDRPYWAFSFLALAFLVKMSYILVVPFLVIGFFLTRSSVMQWVLRMVLGIGIFITIVIGMYGPFYTSKATITKPLSFLLHQPPTKSLAEVVGDVIYFAPQLFAGDKTQLQSNIHKAVGDVDPQVAIWNNTALVGKIFAFLISLILFFRFFRPDMSPQVWIQLYARFLLLFLLFYSPIFYPWYPILVLPFLFLECDKRMIQWLFVFTCGVSLQDMACIADRHTIAYYILVFGFTFLSVVVYVWRFRRVFFLSLNRAEPN